MWTVEELSQNKIFFLVSVHLFTALKLSVSWLAYVSCALKLNNIKKMLTCIACRLVLAGLSNCAKLYRKAILLHRKLHVPTLATVNAL